MTTSYWWCLTCPAGGEYVEPNTKTDTSPPAKHGHATVATTSAEFAARIAGAA